MLSKLICYGIPATRSWVLHKHNSNAIPRRIPQRMISQSLPKSTKFVQFLSCEDPNQIHIGYMDGLDNVVDLNTADLRLPFTMIDLLRDPNAFQRIEK